tara:strand:- start:6258 stop:6560 length:303 start_codon:yes stop_codon:yes gene_type:complete
MSQSHLVEPGVKYFLRESLKQCSEIKKQYYNLYFNIGAFLFIVTLVGSILWIKYKGKMTPIEKDIKMRRDKMYILEKLKAIPNPRLERNMITDLPKWQDI